MSPQKMATPATEDRISSLLDEIICHILSFIPTKHAVATSILSKRWKHLWRSVPLLDFTDYDLEDMDSILRFNHFVYSVLLSREAARNLSIDSFILDLAYEDPNHINSLTIPNLITWLNHVVQRGVKYLHLLLSIFNYVDYDDDNDHEYVAKLPNIIFSCKTLVVLNLTWFSVKGFSFSSAGFEFPLLKTLHLSYIDFPQHRDFMLLLARCPILEDFKVSNVFVYDEVQKFQDLSLSKLIRADIASCYRSFPIKALFNSKFLTIQLNEEYTPYNIPNFHNLTHLVINNDWDLAVQVLHHCPKLQNLELYQKMQVKWVDPKSAPQCISLYLRTCTIQDFPFVGLHRHIMLARYILQNARVLQTMTIWSGSNQHEIERELSSCPRASVTCKLSVY